MVTKLSDDVEAEYPVLWSQVIYSGTHCGDFLRVDEVKKLEAEIAVLRSRDLSVLNKLIVASLAFDMPIEF